MTMHQRPIPVPVLVLYRAILPLLVLSGLLALSGLVPRPPFLGSSLADLMTRLFLCVWFCGSYWSLPRVPSAYGHQRGLLSDSPAITPWQLVLHYLSSLFLGLGAALVTRWAIYVFLPFLGPFAGFISIANGLAFVIPLARQTHIWIPRSS